MKKYLVLFVVIFAMPLFAQFKNSAFPRKSIDEGMLAKNSSDYLFGLINPNNFQMHQSYSMSYSTFGSQGVALGVYTNSMRYKFNKNLNVQLDASIIHSPYNTFGKNFSNNINGFYISRAAINWKPWKNVSISVQYRNLPGSFYSGYYGGNGYGLYNGLLGDSPFIGR
ncbi:MAG TPA: hypothetical protein ENI76_03225 [Ignavibacteria bacterium]|nr:hypothetical protein [Ignavibacteria bacterium]